MLEELLDLLFRPVSNPRPTKLTAAQIETYNRFGFVAPLDVFTAAEAAANAAYFDSLLRA